MLFRSNNFFIWSNTIISISSILLFSSKLCVPHYLFSTLLRILMHCHLISIRIFAASSNYLLSLNHQFHLLQLSVFSTRLIGPNWLFNYIRNVIEYISINNTRIVGNNRVFLFEENRVFLSSSPPRIQNGRRLASDGWLEDKKADKQSRVIDAPNEKMH